MKAVLVVLFAVVAVAAGDFLPPLRFDAYNDTVANGAVDAAKTVKQTIQVYKARGYGLKFDVTVGVAAVIVSYTSSDAADPNAKFDFQQSASPGQPVSATFPAANLVNVTDNAGNITTYVNVYGIAGTSKYTLTWWPLDVAAIPTTTTTTTIAPSPTPSNAPSLSTPTIFSTFLLAFVYFVFSK